jgi:hypothetical protein
MIDFNYLQLTENRLNLHEKSLNLICTKAVAWKCKLGIAIASVLVVRSCLIKKHPYRLKGVYL